MIDYTPNGRDECDRDSQIERAGMRKHGFYSIIFEAIDAKVETLIELHIVCTNMVNFPERTRAVRISFIFHFSFFSVEFIYL